MWLCWHYVGRWMRIKVDVDGGGIVESDRDDLEGDEMEMAMKKMAR